MIKSSEMRFYQIGRTVRHAYVQTGNNSSVHIESSLIVTGIPAVYLL